MIISYEIIIFLKQIIFKCYGNIVCFLGNQNLFLCIFIEKTKI